MMATAQLRIYETPTIPDRLYFKIGDVARLCGVETYVLRFWETQFPQLKPNKSGTGQRLYRRRDVEVALEIKHLVHGEGYTLMGARQALEQGPRRGQPQAMLPLGNENEAGKSQDARLESAAALIHHARVELREILRQLTAPEPLTARRRARVAAMPARSSELLFPG